MDDTARYAYVFDFVRSVPVGKVVTYGQIADEVYPARLTARDVGTAMRFAPRDVPWQRVVGAKGYLPIAKRSPELHLQQRRLLEQEGVAFLAGDTSRVDMRLSQWLPEGQSQGSLFDEGTT